MNTRYKFITQKDEYELENYVRNAFLAGQNGEDAIQIINGLLTTDEKIKIGRRIEVAMLLRSGMSGEDIKSILGVGRDTITVVAKHVFGYPKCFELIEAREKKVEKVYSEKSISLRGGSKLVHKQKTYTGFTRKEVRR